MDLIALRFIAPLQSWGDSSVFNARSTRSFPTKSGVIGLLASAFGIDRNESERLEESGLKNIDLAIRIDNQGSLLQDYQIVKNGEDKNKISLRDFRTDAKFLVLVSHPEKRVLDNIEKYLQNPENLLFFGRKSCVPSVPIYINRFEQYGSFEEALQNIDFIGSRKNIAELPSIEVKAVITDPNGTLELSDVPVSFEARRRKFITRRVRVDSIHLTNNKYIPENSFDPMEVADVLD